MSSTVRGARARARIEVTAAIKDEARRQLASEGAAKLSLRAVARELGMVSSALYRYFPSRDDLLTALIIDAYDSLGERAEAAHAAVADAAPVERWVTVGEAARGWALAHPHEYALIYGSPVPGYSAPEATVPAAARVGVLLIDIVRDAHRAHALEVPLLTDDLVPEAVRMAADLAPTFHRARSPRSWPPGPSCSGWSASSCSGSSTGSWRNATRSSDTRSHDSPTRWGCASAVAGDVCP